MNRDSKSIIVNNIKNNSRSIKLYKLVHSGVLYGFRLAATKEVSNQKQVIAEIDISMDLLLSKKEYDRELQELLNFRKNSINFSVSNNLLWASSTKYIPLGWCNIELKYTPEGLLASAKEITSGKYVDAVKETDLETIKIIHKYIEKRIMDASRCYLI